MNYSIWPNICTILIIVSFLLYYFYGKPIKIKQNTILVSLMATIALDAALTVFLYINNPCSYEFTFILSIVSLYFLTLSLSLVIVYAVAIVKLRLSVSDSVLLIGTPPVLLTVLLYFNNESNILFKISTKGNIIPEPLYGVLYIFYLYYFIMSALIVRRHYRNISRDILTALPGIGIILPVGIILDYYFPEALSLHFTLALCTILLFLCMQDSNEYYSQDSLFMNRSAFTTLYSGSIESGTHTLCIAVSIHNSELLVTTVERSKILYAEDLFVKSMGSHIKKISVFKLGDGSYIVIIKDGKKETQEIILQKIQDSLHSMTAPKLFTFPVYSTASAFCCPKDITGLRMIDRLFDKLKALEHHKKSQIINIEDLALQSEADLLEVEEIVKTAITDNRIEVYYQPIYNAKTGTYTCAEALVRISDGKGGYLPPDVFIPIAEKTSLILDIGDHVLRRVCETLSEENLEQYGLEYIEVNLSIVECLQTNLAAKIMGTLCDYEIKPSQINLEITETASDDFTDIVDRNINTLHNCGIRFSIDDFGTGYSSLTRILALNVQLIKLDKSIVQAPFLSSDKNAMLLLESFVNTASSTGAKLVAEGVESKEMAKRVIELGCDYLQGFYFEAPLTRKDFVEALKKNASPPV